MGEAEELEEKLARLERIAASVPEYLVEIDRAGVITYMNRPSPDRTIDDMLGTSVYKWMKPDAHPAATATFARVFDLGEPESYESTGSTNGRNYVTRVAPVLAAGRADRAILVTHDITDLKQAELRLREREEWFRTLIDGYIDAMAVSEQGRLMEVNAACGEMFGYEPKEMIGLTAGDLATPESLATVLDWIRRGDTSAYEVVGRRKNGETFPARIQARNVTYQGRPARISFFRDLTEEHRARGEQRRHEEQMLSAQKLETLGRLAGGIAHDFNNLLQVILGNVELAALNVGEHPAHASLRGQLEHARDAALRGSEIVHQMLDYTGQRTRSIRALKLGAVTREMAELLRVSVSKDTDLVLELPEAMPEIRADATQVRQVIMNLITNASEALGDRAGRVRIRVGAATLDPDEIAAMVIVPVTPLRDTVFVEVSDTGAGMSQAEIRRIFDPFYTTKFAGRGLGLPSVGGIVRAHGGAIRVASALGAGSTFTVFFPATAVLEKREPSVPAAASVRTALSGRVLIADDEPRLLEFLARTLSRAGLEVTSVGDGEEAVRALRATPNAFDVAVLDLTMPRLGGQAALGQIRKMRPDLPALLLSGYTDAELGEDLDDGKTAFLAKPFQNQSLLDRLGELLNRRSR